MASRRLSLYLHVPFCTRTCPYCNFYQVRHGAEREGAFVEAVLTEAALARRDLLPEGGRLATLYWGGGTPSLLSEDSIARLAEGVAALFEVPAGIEFTVEANPGELSPGTLRALRAAGANRLSLGCQSFQPDRLAFLGRWHTPQQNRDAVLAARAEGFDNVSLDLISNLPPSLPPEGLRVDVEEVLALEPEHVSLYGLTLEPRTVFGRRAERGTLSLLEPDDYAREYLWAATRLASAGLEHYETSSFARPGRESAHNSRYWSGGDYLGLGPGAHSLWEGRRWANAASLETWLTGVAAGAPPRELDDARDAAALYAETLYLGLRSRAGLPLAVLRGEVGEIARFTRELVAAGLTRTDTLPEAAGDRLVLTDGGHLLLDEIVARLLALSPISERSGAGTASRPELTSP